MEAPKCRLCQKNHWAREGCNGMLTERNIQREGRRVLKGSTGQPAKPTRTASTERTDPPKPAKAPADSAIAEKAGVGIPKPRKEHKSRKVMDGVPGTPASVQSESADLRRPVKTRAPQHALKKKVKKSKPTKESTR